MVTRILSRTCLLWLKENGGQRVLRLTREMRSPLNTVHIKHVVKFFDDNTSYDLTEIDEALARKVRINTIPAVPEAFAEWLEAIAHGYDTLTPIHKEVNELYVQYERLMNTSVETPRTFDIHPKHSATGKDLLPPSVEMYDAVLLGQKDAPLRKRLLLLARAKVLKEYTLEKLKHAVDVILNDVPSLADRLNNIVEAAFKTKESE
ncbi:hypothetical protein LTR78_004983 [Recurvomyces mirabilis]|uniref:Uncharacterized protein n=1 Tax=Recurvomyces mirabilis TaxID=574656 RepID=A0AAE0WNJ6_9PEZI|nr:hypothetical protein LTR78_004983 [Recurvomyces mirabilis]KAK5158401.1 hypothetical protein LTS14_003419 [Recurvomyces mirabilis]